MKVYYHSLNRTKRSKEKITVDKTDLLFAKLHSDICQYSKKELAEHLKGLIDNATDEQIEYMYIYINAKFNNQGIFN